MAGLELGYGCSSCELIMPFGSEGEVDPAALVEVVSQGVVSVTWLTDAASLTVSRRGSAKESLELGESLGDVAVGSRLELVPSDPAQGGQAGDWVWLVSAFKTPPRVHPAASADVTPAAITSGRMVVPPSSMTGTAMTAGGRALGAADGTMATPLVPLALQAAAAGSVGKSGGCTGKRAAEQEVQPAGAPASSPGESAVTAPAATQEAACHAPVSSAKRQRLEHNTAAVPAEAGEEQEQPLAGGDADMADVQEQEPQADQPAPQQQQEEQQEVAQMAQAALAAALACAETQVLDLAEAAEPQGEAPRQPAQPATAAPAAAEAPSPACTAAMGGEEELGGEHAYRPTEEGGEGAAAVHPAAAFVPPTQAVLSSGAGDVEEGVAEEEREGMGEAAQQTIAVPQEVAQPAAAAAGHLEQEAALQAGQASGSQPAAEQVPQQAVQAEERKPAPRTELQQQPGEDVQAGADACAAPAPAPALAAAAVAADGAAAATPAAPFLGRAGRLPAGAVASDMVGATVQQCRELLGRTRRVLLDQQEGRGSSLATAQRAAAWVKDLTAMEERSEMKPVVIGVLGNTGAGKSSCLNTLLGEEEVLPQSGMRACTACVVEVSHAHGSAYTAEIEFVTEEEWITQVEGLWDDLAGEDGHPQITRGDRNPDSRSMHGAAQIVLESVLGRDVVRHPRVTLQKLLAERNAATRCAYLSKPNFDGLCCMHLGRTVNVRELEAKKFRKQIGKYVDSNNRRDDISTWPLVKVCRIRHSWPVLATGAMLVDLPGVRDANAARGRVAEAYLKKCSAIWVCADITRAVDDRTAKELLGDSFRRQMMMDGQFGSISFICSKSDNIMPREVIDGLGVDEICALTDTSLEDFTKLENQILDRQDAEAELQRDYNRALRAVKKALRRQGDCEGRLQVIRELISARGGDFGRDDGLPGDAPGGSGASRGAAGSNDDFEMIAPDSEADEEDGSGMESGADSDEEADDAGSGSEDESGNDEDEEVSLAEARREGFREGKRRAKKAYKTWSVARLRQERDALVGREQEAAEARREGDRTKRAVRTQLDGVKRELHKLQLQMNGICSRARNAYSKEQLKRDFKEGIEAVEAAGAVGARAATAAELDLPVFCISARDAQKLEGRCRKDSPVSAFAKLEHTEIPSLREHVHDIARRGRIHTARSLVSALSSFVVSTALLLRDQSELNVEVGESVRAAFETQTAALQQDLAARLGVWGQELERLVISEGLSPPLEAGAVRAEAKAVGTSTHWGDPPRAGGYYWGTYKATVKRGGDYTGGVRGEVSFNGDLASPLLDAVAVQWDNTFGNKISGHLEAFRELAVAALSAALGSMQRSVAELGLDDARVERLCSHVLQDERGRLEETVAGLLGPVGDKQRELSRDVIKPAVKEHMTDVYQRCAAEVGSGQFDRMRRAMREHVEGKKGVMFKDAQRTMERELRAVVTELYRGVQHLAAAMLGRLAHHFSVLWERPPSNEAQRAVAVAALTALARQAADVCSAAGAAPSASLTVLLAAPPAAARRPPPLAPPARLADSAITNGIAAMQQVFQQPPQQRQQRSLMARVKQEPVKEEPAAAEDKGMRDGGGVEAAAPRVAPHNPLAPAPALPALAPAAPGLPMAMPRQMPGMAMLGTVMPEHLAKAAQAAAVQQQAVLQQRAAAGDRVASLMLQQMMAATAMHQQHVAAMQAATAAAAEATAAAARQVQLAAQQGPAEAMQVEQEGQHLENQPEPATAASNDQRQQAAGAGQGNEPHKEQTAAATAQIGQQEQETQVQLADAASKGGEQLEQGVVQHSQAKEMAGSGSADGNGPINSRDGTVDSKAAAQGEVAGDQEEQQAGEESKEAAPVCAVVCGAGRGAGAPAQGTDGAAFVPSWFGKPNSQLVLPSESQLRGDAAPAAGVEHEEEMKEESGSKDEEMQEVAEEDELGGGGQENAAPQQRSGAAACTDGRSPLVPVPAQQVPSAVAATECNASAACTASGVVKEEPQADMPEMAPEPAGKPAGTVIDLTFDSQMD